MRIPKVCITHSNSVKSQTFDGKKKENIYQSQPSMSIDKSKKDTFCLSKKK